MPPATITRRNTMPEQPQDNAEGPTLYQAVLSSVNASPESSTSTLPTVLILHHYHDRHIIVAP